MLLPKFLSRKISPEKSLDFLSEKSVVRPALGHTPYHVCEQKCAESCSSPGLLPEGIFVKVRYSVIQCVVFVKVRYSVLQCVIRASKHVLRRL